MNLMIRIIQLRRERKLTQHMLARMLGISRSALAQWETGANHPNYESLKKIADVLSVSFEWLATGRGSKDINHPETSNLSDEELQVQLQSQIQHALLPLSTRKKQAILNMVSEMR